MPPKSKLYEFDHLIAENDLSQSWVAVRRDSGEKCFIKCPSDVAGLPAESKADILRRSYQLQSRVKTPGIVTARAIHSEGGNLFVEYPYFDSSRLHEVTIDDLAAPGSGTFIKLAICVDYLHLLGIVHLDLKLDNFRLLATSRGNRLVLLDLDNIEETNRRPGHRITGTPGHIAPEVINNDVLTGRSDLYSLGHSLAQAVDESAPGSGRDKNTEEEVNRFRLMIADLTREVPVHRPELMLQAARNAGLINDEQLRQSQKTLLAMLLLTRFRSHFNAVLHGTIDLEKEIFHSVKAYSLPQDLIAGLQSSIRSGPRLAVNAFADLLKQSEVIRYGEFWHVDFDDKRLLETLERLDEISDSEATRSQGAGPLKEYLTAILRVDQNRPPDAPEHTLEWLKHTGELAVALNRFRDAAMWLQRAVAAAEPGTEEHLALLYSLVQPLMASGDLTGADRHIEQGIAFASQAGMTVWELDFRRVKAWLTGYRGDHSTAERLLREIVAEARTLGHGTVEAKALGDLTAVVRSSGRLREAEPIFDECLSRATALGVQSEVAVTYYSGALRCFQRGDYDRAISLAKLSYKFVNPVRHGRVLPYLNLVLTNSHTRLGEYSKADFWLARSLALVHRQPSSVTYAVYYSNLGWGFVVRGRLDEAERALNRALEIMRGSELRGEVSMCYRNLAEAAFLRGDYDRCCLNIDNARKTLEKWPDNVTEAELRLFDCLNRYYYGGRNNLPDCLASAQELLERGCLNYAATALIVLLTEQPIPWWDDKTEFIRDLATRFSSVHSPMYEALGRLLQPVLKQDFPVGKQILAAKSAYRILESASQLFLAAQVCRYIAQLYFTARQPRLGERFLKQARTLAAQLSNRRVIADLNQLAQAVPAAEYGRDQLLRSFNGIANILSDGDHRAEPFQEVLRFAVDTVEAERGVLMLRSSDKGELRVRAYMNCDDASLREIVDYSRSIPEDALRLSSPLYVRDALSDDRTKKYKSIVAHNVRSVLCVPIAYRGETEGVIYLDHHTIPALFDEGDLEFIKSLSKFVSLMLHTVLRADSSDQYAKYLESGLDELGAGREFVTQDESMRALLEQIRRLSASNTSILVCGESGTGKEILCRMIHEFSPRRQAPFVKLNCAAVTESLVESELFGVADQTATGVKARAGKFETADGGTLFLDEIGDMPLSLQSKVLRVLEYQEFERVGSNKTIFTDVRFVYATNRDLQHMVSEKRFREDLYYRICGVELRVPPLRERPGDIRLLAEHFNRVLSAGKCAPISLSAQAVQVLEAYDWPGNVRQLRNLVERLLLLYPGKVISPGVLPAEIMNAAGAPSSSHAMAEKLESSRIRNALEQFGWNQSAAASFLSITLSSLRRRIKKYGIQRS